MQLYFKAYFANFRSPPLQIIIAQSLIQDKLQVPGTRLSTRLTVFSPPNQMYYENRSYIGTVGVLSEVIHVLGHLCLRRM